MFDTNVFSDLIYKKKTLIEISKKYSIYVTTIQLEEIAEIPDSNIEKRKQNLFVLATARVTFVPISVFVLGKARLDLARLGNGEVYNKILNKTKTNVNDAIIADTSVFEACTLVTSDIKLYNKMKRNGYDVITAEELFNSIDKVGDLI